MNDKVILFTKIKKNSLRACFFLARQLYRICIIIPYTLIVSVIQFLITLFNKKSPRQYSGVCFIITSVIYPKQKSLSYAQTRSVYSPEERALQTIKTIESIRERVPAAKIVLIESGLQRGLPFNLDKKVDMYVYVGDNFFVRRACDSKFKSLGEAAMLLVGTKNIELHADLYFKISGRYFLDENFTLNAWQTEHFRFFYIRPDYVSTRLYSFGKDMLLMWKFALIKGLPLLFLDYPIEHILCRFVKNKYIIKADKVGVTGADATTGSIVKE